MSHARQQIRDAIVTLLNASPSNFRRAYNTRIQPAQQVWPYLLVWCGSESVVSGTIHPTDIQDRTATITIEGRLQVPQREVELIETRMDDLAAEIETTLTNTAMLAEVTNLKDIGLNDSTFEVVLSEEDGTVSYAQLTMNFIVRYFTMEGSPETLI